MNKIKTQLPNLVKPMNQFNWPGLLTQLWLELPLLVCISSILAHRLGERDGLIVAKLFYYGYSYGCLDSWHSWPDLQTVKEIELLKFDTDLLPWSTEACLLHNYIIIIICIINYMELIQLNLDSLRNTTFQLHQISSAFKRTLIHKTKENKNSLNFKCRPKKGVWVKD